MAGVWTERWWGLRRLRSSGIKDVFPGRIRNRRRQLRAEEANAVPLRPLDLIRPAFERYQAEMNQVDPSGSLFARSEGTVNINEQGHLLS
jgi:hypothetical protein